MTLRAGTTSIPPTLSRQQVSARHWDVLVVGAGPAGATVAWQLAQRQVSVLLVDKASFPRWKVCGCCLNGAALTALAAIGLGDLPQRLGAARLHHMHLAVGTVTASLDLPDGVSLSREALDAGLIQAAIDAGVAFLPETEAILQPQVTDCASRASETWRRRLLHVVARGHCRRWFGRYVFEIPPAVSHRRGIWCSDWRWHGLRTGS